MRWRPQPSSHSDAHDGARAGFGRLYKPELAPEATCGDAAVLTPATGVVSWFDSVALMPKLLKNERFTIAQSGIPDHGAFEAQPCAVVYLAPAPQLGEAASAAIEILDVGAMIEGQPRYDGLLRQGSCRITGFEVNPERIPEIRAALPPGSQVLPYALGDGNPATLHITLYRGCCSLFKPNADVIDMFESIFASSETGNFRVVGEVNVETVRLDDVDECPSADYAKLDVQGAELLVLEHVMQKLADAVIIETEVEFVEIYRGA